MALVGKKLASNAMLDKVLCICSGRRPVESYMEGLANKGLSCGVVPAETGMNLSQELPPLLLGDTPLKDSGSAFLVELSFVNFIGLRTPDNAAGLVLITGPASAVLIGLASIHLVNLSTMTSRYFFYGFLL